MEADREQSYWCFICEKQFKTHLEAQACPYCSSTAFEAIATVNNNTLPSSFQVYEIPQPAPQQRNNIQQPPQTNMFPTSFVQAIQFSPGFNIMSIALPQLNNQIINTFNQIQQTLLAPGGGIANLINSLLGQNNLIPATPQQIRNLEKINQVPECSICQQENDKIENLEERKGLKLKCGHMFHHHCIGPWFQRTNTCPSCRVRI